MNIEYIHTEYMTVTQADRYRFLSPFYRFNPEQTILNNFCILCRNCL